MPAQDAFYTLPDSLLSFILSKIPIKDAVKSSILSKRWRFLYTQMPKLHFSPYLILGPNCPPFDPLLRPTIENIISNILFLHSQNLEAFHLDITWIDANWLRGNPWRFSHENVCKWVRHAAWCNVQHLSLFDGALKETPPAARFSCTRLATLSLCNYVLTSFPTNFVGFPHLITCYLCDVQLTDESLASLVSLCPLLQKLEITGASGLSNVVIFSSTIEHLTMGVKSLSINCPKLKMLSGSMIKDLTVNGVRFYELSYAISELKIHCASSPRELSMDCSQGCRPGLISTSRFLHIVGNFQFLKELTIYRSEPYERETEMDILLLTSFTGFQVFSPSIYWASSFRYLCKLPNLKLKS